MRGNSLPITILIVLVLIGTALVPPPAAAEEPSATAQESSATAKEPSTHPWFVAVVGGNEVVNPFVVTEVYVPQGGAWRLASLSFTRLLTPP